MTSQFSIQESALEGLMVCTRRQIGDQRGFFERLFCSDELKRAGFTTSVCQANLSHTAAAGTVRGLHFQLPPAQETKLVSCISGTIFDVAVDLRRGSKTFLQWHGEELSSGNRRAMLIPAGFAHGFQALSEDCTMVYFHAAPYDPELESGLDAADPAIGVRWPLDFTLRSRRDTSFQCIGSDFEGFVY